MTVKERVNVIRISLCMLKAVKLPHGCFLLISKRRAKHLVPPIR